MRYGVIRICEDLPPAASQRRLIEAAGCDVILEERSTSPSGRKILMQLLHSLKDGDAVIVHGVEAFDMNVGELARLLRRFHEAGVTLRLVGGAQVEDVVPQGPAPPALVILADFETRYRTPTPTRRRARTSPQPLTPHQLRFARDMRRRGHSPRAIGLVFQLSPEEVSSLIGRGRDEDEEINA